MGKTKKIKIKFNFINDKNEKKEVYFYMDEKYYKDLHDPSITEEQRNECLLAEYRMACKDDKYKRRHVEFETDDEGFVIEKPDLNQLSPEEKFYKEELFEEEIKLLQENIKLVRSIKQQAALTCKYIKCLKNKESAKLLRISEGSFSELLKRSEKEMKKIILAKK